MVESYAYVDWLGNYWYLHLENDEYFFSDIVMPEKTIQDMPDDYRVDPDVEKGQPPKVTKINKE